MKKNTEKKGFILIISVLILGTLLMLGSYLVSLANSENKIAHVQFLASKNYYLAETGVNDMIWKIQNDQATRTAFLNGTLDATSDISKTNVFGDNNAAFQAAARNTVPAEAWIIATSTYQIVGNVSQRVVKSYISRAMGNNLEWPFATFAGGRGSQQNGNFIFTGSGIVLTSNGGRLHANQVFKVQGAEVVVNNGTVTASNVINVVAGGRLTLNNSYQNAPTSTIDMLQIDFDSASVDSWKNRATVSYTEAQFNSLPNNTTLDGIIYVNGNANITNKNFTINGILIASGSITITASSKVITVNTSSGYGGGILAKGDVTINTSGGALTINGLIYAANELTIISSGTNFTVNGSMVGFDARVTASSGSIILNYTPSNFQPVINPIYNTSAPLIQIDHWEEEY